MAAINKKLSYFARYEIIIKYLLIINDNMGVVYIYNVGVTYSIGVYIHNN